MRLLVLALALLAGCADVSSDSWTELELRVEQEEDVSAPLFIRTPYMVTTRVNAGGLAAALETIAEHSVDATTQLLIEKIRVWFTPGPVGGRGAGYWQLAILPPYPDDVAVYLEHHVVGAMAEGEYPEPVEVQLDLQLPPGYALQLISTPENTMAGLPAICHVVAQGGELG